MAKGEGTTLLLLAGIGAAVYYYRTQIEAELATLGINLPGLGPAPGAIAPVNLGPVTQAPVGAQITNASPITINTPGAVPVGTQGCYQYAGMISCPAGVSPPAGATPQNNCQPGYAIDASGVCTLYSDSELLAGLNSIPWTGSTAIPTEQINRIDPLVLANFASEIGPGVVPGTVLAYMLGLGANTPAAGATSTGSDGNLYTFTNGVWIFTPASAAAAAQSGAALQGLGRLGAIAQALPISNETLTQASHNPEIAAMVGNDQRALLTVPQWNYFYGQASGVVQTNPQHPAGDPGARVNAATYHQLRTQAGLTVRLGTLRPYHTGAFPLGSIRPGPAHNIPYVFPGNRTIYRIPGRGAVISPAAARRMLGLGVIQAKGGNHRWARSPFPRPSWWRQAE